MDNGSFDPNILARPESGFRFPPRTSFTSDLGTTEFRLVIIGWLKQAEQIITSNGGIQELRDAVFRINDLVIALSAKELQAFQAEAERKKTSVSHRQSSIKREVSRHGRRKKTQGAQAAPSA